MQSKCIVYEAQMAYLQMMFFATGEGCEGCEG